MRRVLNKAHLSYVLLIAIVYASLFVWKHNLIERLLSSEVSGRVVDFSASVPMEMIAVKSGSVVTYTNYRGEFMLRTKTRSPLVSIDIPKSFEPGNENLQCKVTQKRLLDESFFCEALLFPQSFEVASRVLNDEKALDSPDADERLARMRHLWDRVAKVSRDAFGAAEEEFLYLMSRKEEIDLRRDVGLVDFVVEGKASILENYSDSITKDNITNVAEVKVVRHFGDGSEAKAKERFTRESGVWHYLLPFGYLELRNFVTKNEWVLKLKRTK